MLTEAVLTVLKAEGFMYDSNMECWSRGEYTIYFSGVKSTTIRRLVKVKKNDLVELKARVVVFNGRYTDGHSLDTIINCICYDRED